MSCSGDWTFVDNRNPPSCCTRMLHNSVRAPDSASRKSSRKTEWRSHEQCLPSILEKEWDRDCGDRKETVGERRSARWDVADVRQAGAGGLSGWEGADAIQISRGARTSVAAHARAALLHEGSRRMRKGRGAF